MFTNKTNVVILAVLAIAAALVYIDPTNAMLHGTAASGERDRRTKGSKAFRVTSGKAANLGKNPKTPKTPKAPKAATDADPAMKQGMLAAGYCCILPPPHPQPRHSPQTSSTEHGSRPGRPVLRTL